MEKEMCQISEFIESCNECGFCKMEKEENELPKNKVYSVAEILELDIFKIENGEQSV